MSSAKSTLRRRRAVTAPLDSRPTEKAETARAPTLRPSRPPPPFLLDFFPLESAEQTRLSRFYQRLREGRLSTTKCRTDGELHWPPRTACPVCHTTTLDWVDLPEEGRVYAFSAVLAGAPLGMEPDLPFVVGLVDLDGVGLRIFGRIEGAPWQACRIGQRVRVESYEAPEERVFYRFRVVDRSS